MGYQVVTQLVGFEGDTDQNQGYLINSELPPKTSRWEVGVPRGRPINRALEDA